MIPWKNLLDIPVWTATVVLTMLFNDEFKEKVERWPVAIFNGTARNILLPISGSGLLLSNRYGWDLQHGSYDIGVKLQGRV